MSSLVSVEMKMKVSNFNISMSLSDKIDVISSLIKDFETIQKNLRSNEIVAFRSSDKDKWRQMRKDGLIVSNHIGELARLKIDLLDERRAIQHDNYIKIMNTLQSI
jgi:hypothetical protein